MDYVESLDFLGVSGRQRPCLLGHGAPTTATVGGVGEFYMDIDTDTGKLYKCTAAVDGVYTWVDTEEKIGDIEAALDRIIAIQESLIGGDSA